ncbi:MAG: hypothetical protein GC188_07875 [Alphaproteobacteria bacterium]|jgi:Family of unknown function (DUF5681)|nr:hypothetical protein [Alphaproteobacteria bacterium]
MATPDKIGYGHPPKHSQFKPGQSGNPRGRKAKTTALIEESARILSEPVKTRDKAGRKQTLRMLEASYLALCKKALTGNRAALLDVMRTLLLVGPQIDDANAEWDNYIRQSLEQIYRKLRLPQDEIEKLLKTRSTS